MLSWFRSSKKTEVEEPEEQFTPRDPRASTFAEAFIISPFQMKIHGALVDLSETGARLRFRTLSGIQAGDRISVCVPLKNIRRKAEVIWRDQYEIGVEFDNAMTRAKVGRLKQTIE